jgi:3-hydroxyisobutyrate dehydrogenase-like beta-hydroxyacid dehydrogenase
MKVGFIGLGSMGGPIARRIARGGYDVVACDNDPAMLAAFDEPGVSRESDAIATARQVEVLGTCVRTDEQLEELAGDGRLFEALGKGGTFIVHSTVKAALVRRLAEVAKAHGVDFLDIGVSGGTAVALDGGLLLLMGGDAAIIDRVRPILETYGKMLVHFGPIGRGMEAKILNNILAIANYGMAVSVLDLGEKLNFDREVLRKALLGGSGAGTALHVVEGMLAPSGLGATSTIPRLHDLLKKDVELADTLVSGEDPSLAVLSAGAWAMLDRLASMPEFSAMAEPQPAA